MSNIKKRLGAVEEKIIEAGRDNPLPAGERIVALYPGDDASLARLKAEKISYLREKYGPSVTESDLVWIRVVYENSAGVRPNISQDNVQ